VKKNNMHDFKSAGTPSAALQILAERSVSAANLQRASEVPAELKSCMLFFFTSLTMLRYMAIICCLFISSISAQSKTAIDENVQKLAQVNNTFAFQLFRNLDHKDANLCFSPYSISSAFAMTYDGARGTTQKEMEHVLGFTSVATTVDSGFSWLNQYLSMTSSDLPTDFRLFIANSLWIQTGKNVLPEFLEQMTKYYKGSLRYVDFVRQSETARNEINNWVKEKTQGKIANLLSPNNLTAATRMVLVSAIYMKARWATLFNKENTTQLPFFSVRNQTMSVPTMTNTAYYPFYHDNEVTVVELPYILPKPTAPQLSMFIILPNDQSGLKSLEQKISADSFNKWRTQMNKERILLFLPKFEITKSFNLNDSLIAMGMVNALGKEADFSGIDGVEDLQIGQVIHKAYISADENGTEAAAATAISMELKSVFNNKEPIMLRVDHPFLFIIYEKASGSILFMGRVVNPLE